MVLEIAIVILLTLINGVLAMSELAIVSARPARLKLMVEKGSRGAVVVAITHLSLIVGELVPHQIALRAPEQVTARMAR